MSTKTTMAGVIGAALVGAVVVGVWQHSAIPVAEFPVNITLGLRTEKIVKGENWFGLVHNNSLLVWNETGEWRDFPLTNWTLRTGGGAAGVIGDRLIVSSPGNQLPIVGSIAEYRLHFSNSLPVAAEWISTLPFAPNGRDARVVTTQAGGVVVATVPGNATYQGYFAYRSPAGDWTFYHQDYYVPIVPAFDSDLAEGADGVLFQFIVCDTSGRIACARWQEQAGALKFLDFRWDFFPSAGVHPDGEMPMNRVERDPYHPGRILGTIQVSDGSIIDCVEEGNWRWCHPVIYQIETFAPPPPLKIESWCVDYQNLHFTFQLTPYEWEAFVGPSLNQWLPVSYIYNQTAVGGSLSVSAVNPLYVDGNWPVSSYFLRLEALSFRRGLVATIPDFIERSSATVPFWPKADGVVFALQPMQGCVIGQWVVKEYSYATGGISGAAVDFNILSWGAGYAMVARGSSLAVRRMT